MSHIHFLKEGGGDSYACRMRSDLPIAIATVKLSIFSVRFYETAPIINPNTPALKDSQYKYVVLEVEAGEENKKFPNAGYYIIDGMTPRDCADIFEIYY